MNFERPTTCRYDMPHVVAYVVAYVVLVWGVDVCFGRLQTCRGARVGRQWATARNRCAIARCAGGLPARAVTKGEIVDSGRRALS